MGLFQKVYVIGNTNVDIIFHVDRIPLQHEKMRAESPSILGGGSAGNTACWLSHLNHPVTMVTAVGDDLFADFTIKSFEEQGVAVEYGLRQPGTPSGVAVILSSGTDKRMIIGAPTISIVDQLIDTLELSAGEHIHFASSSVSLTRKIVDKARRHGVTVSCEFNGKWYPERIEMCDACFSNMDELVRIGLDRKAITDHMSRASADHLLVVTNGAEAVLCFSSEGVVENRVEPVSPVDRTGAGDAFNAGFLHAWIARQSVEECLKSGRILAMRVLLQNGARPLLLQ